MTRYHSPCFVKSFSLWNVHPPRSQCPSTLDEACGSARWHVRYLGATCRPRNNKTASWSSPCVSRSSPGPPDRRVVIQCPAADWCGAVGRHLLLRSCKIPSSHGFVYARPFSYPGNVQHKKNRAQKHTNCVQITTEEMQLQETHSPPTLP